MKKYIWIVVTLLAFDCATDDFHPDDEEKCRVGEYVYKQVQGVDSRYDISYLENSLTWVEIINDQTQAGSEWSTNMTYKHFYRNDSLIIKDFRQFREGATYLTAQLKTELQSVITSFPDNNGKYRFSFDYSQDDQVTVTLEKLVGNVATFDSRGVYSLDDLGDVTKLVITRNPDLHGNDPDPFTTREITYTYDIVLNPLKDLVLPHFLKAELPDITYFSMNNRLTETHDGNTYTYKFEYGTDPMPTKQTKPDGTVEKYEYPNCTN
jgi:hypothetical protein